MGEIAFVFAGQGAQRAGMGKDLYETSPAAKKVFDMADSIRPLTSALCFSGSFEELAETKNTQPALFAVGLACAHALTEAGISADCAAGFSLGEFPALAFCGVLPPEDAFSLVVKRALFMQECAEKRPGAMAAVLRLDAKDVEALCGGFDDLFAVNFNCAGQTVVAGSESALAAFSALAAQKGARVMRLAVSGAFHSPFMNEASERLSGELEKRTLSQPKIPLYSNVTALPYGENIKDLLAAQVKSPVLWEKTVQNMLAAGVDTFVEVGAGKVLGGLIRKIAPHAAVHSVEDARSLAACAAELGGKRC